MSGETVRLWAEDGGEKKRTAAETGEGRQPEATYSVAEAAQATGVPIRTFRDWVTTNKVRHLPPAPPHRGVRIPASVVDELLVARALERQVPAAEGGDERREEAATGGGLERTAAEGGNSGQPTSAPFDTPASEIPTGNSDVARMVAAYEELFRAKEEALQRERALVEEVAAAKLEAEQARGEKAAVAADRDAVAGERDFLRNQVEQHAKAEAELRVLMLRQSEQIQALQTAQEQQRALVAEVSPAPAQRPWWRFWEK